MISKKIALFVVIILIVPVTSAYIIYNINFAPQPNAHNTQSYLYQANVPNNGQKVVCICFDDGWQTQYYNAMPILNAYGYKATFGIITSFVGTFWGKQNSADLSYMTWNEIVKLSEQGNDIESHTYSHLNLNILSSSAILFQLSQSKQDLLSHGINAPILIYPDGGGAGNNTVQQLVEQYYLAGRSINPGPLNMSQPYNKYDLPSYTMENTTTIAMFQSIVNQANNSTIVILYYHKIDYENVDTATTPETFTAEIQYLHDNNFTVETLKQLFTAPVS